MRVRRRLLPALALLALSARARGATLFLPGERNDSAAGVSLVVPAEHAIGVEGAGARRAPHQPPGDETDPPGVRVYDSLDAVPTGRLLSQAGRHAKCYTRRRAACWKAYVCGHRCEQILLAVDGFCKKKERAAGCRGDRCAAVQWRRCKKARKFNRCFARVCYRRRGTLGHEGVVGTPRPMSYEDTENVAIVRYRRPPPKHLVLAQLKGYL